MNNAIALFMFFVFDVNFAIHFQNSLQNKHGVFTKEKNIEFGFCIRK